MNIAFFVNSFPPETFILNQLTGLIDRGHQVHVEARICDTSFKAEHASVRDYTLRERTRFLSPTPKPWIARIGSGVSRLVRLGWRDPGTTIDTLNVMRYGRRAANLSLLHEWLPEGDSRDYDIVHCHYGANGQRALAMRNAGLLRGRIITTFHGYDVTVLPRLHGPRLYRKLFRQGDLFTIGSEFLRSRIAALGAPEDRVVKLPMGVSLSRFPFIARTLVAGSELRLLSIARLVEMKGIEYALRAIALLKDRYPHLRYTIGGDGPHRGKLEDLGKDLGVEQMCTFMGALSHEEVSKAHADAHLFLLPSVVSDTGAEESQAVALAEAQASGLPVVATSIGGVAESMRGGTSGLLVPPGDPQALAAAISWLAERPEEWGAMGRAGRSHVEQGFELEALNDRLVDIYRSLTTSSGRSSASAPAS